MRHECQPCNIKAQAWDYPLTWAFAVGAGDGNRTRTISLGTCAIRAVSWPDLRGGLSVSDRGGPLFTGVNGPLMARGI